MKLKSLQPRRVLPHNWSCKALLLPDFPFSIQVFSLDMKISCTSCILPLIVSALTAASNDDTSPTLLRLRTTSVSSSNQNGHHGNAAVAPTLSPAPSLVPSNNSSTTPSSTGNETVSPAPTVSPTTANKTISPAPSMAPTNHNETVSPAPSIAPTVSNETGKPTEGPSTSAPTESPEQHHHHHLHLWKLLYKTVSWMIVAGLSVLAFGSCMSNRYRIYYYLRGAWFSFLRLGCTQAVLRTFRLDGFVFGGRRGGGRDSSLNDIIFDGNNNLHEGLLSRETIG
jgi:hypothetical protein